MAKVQTVFLDRDGVINRKCPEGDYVKKWPEFEFLPGAKEALALMTQAHMRLIIVTNQRGIARGLMTESDLQEIHTRMLKELSAAGAVINAIYYCPHEKGQCNCRKPDIGLFLKAQADFPDIDFSEAIMIGDSPDDVEAGNRLGCRTFLISDESQPDRVGTPADPRAGGVPSSAPTLYDAVTSFLLPQHFSS